MPDTLGRAAAESGAGAPWRSSGVASVGAGPGLGRFRGEADAMETWGLNLGVLLNQWIAPLDFVWIFFGTYCMIFLCLFWKYSCKAADLI